MPLKLSTKTMWKEAVSIGGIAFLCSAVLIYVLPWIFYPQYTMECGYDFLPHGNMACDLIESGWVFLRESSGFVGTMIMPFIIGSIVGVLYSVRQKITFFKSLLMSIIAAAIYIVGIAMMEVLLYEPWRSFLTPMGESYSQYDYRAVYGPFWPAMLLAVVFGLLISSAVSPKLWRRFKWI